MGLIVQNISFSYSKKFPILQDISFSVMQGKTLCVLGKSGSGKTTLLKIIAGLLPRNKDQLLSGSIHFNSSDIDKLKSKGELSFMYQKPELLPNNTVKGNVELPIKILGKSFKATVEDTIRIVGLSDSINKYPKDLSGGMETRTALARSFITQPKLLLLDEPFSSLDICWRDTLTSELSTLQKRDNTAIVMVTHELNEALEIGDEIIILSHDGAILGHFNMSSTDKAEVLETSKQILAHDHMLFLNSQ